MNEALPHHPEYSLETFMDRLNHLIPDEHPILEMLKKKVIRLFVRKRAERQLDSSLGLDQIIWQLAASVFARLKDWFVRGEHERLMNDFFNKVQVQSEMAMLAAILLKEPMRALAKSEPLAYQVIVLTTEGDLNKSDIAQSLGISRYKANRHWEKGIQFIRNYFANKERQWTNGPVS